jgi:ElaB/YqjD/DUF883 family membrane-anchored ribosome-binding protein
MTAAPRQRRQLARQVHAHAAARNRGAASRVCLSPDEVASMNATTNGENAKAADTAEVKEHLRAAGDAAANAARARAAQAQEWARNRASQAQDWARSQWGDVQHRIEAQPYKAVALALGIGLLAGVLLTTLATRRSD